MMAYFSFFLSPLLPFPLWGRVGVGEGRGWRWGTGGGGIWNVAGRRKKQVVMDVRVR